MKPYYEQDGCTIYHGDCRDFGEAWGSRPALVFGTWKAPRPKGVRMLLVWDTKGALGMGDLSLPWKPSHQEIYVLGSGFTGRRDSDVLCYAPVQSMAKNGRTHPHEKPLGLLRDLISKCPPGIIADPFMGTGATLVAAKLEGRVATGIEIEERYMCGERFYSFACDGEYGPNMSACLSFEKWKNRKPFLVVKSQSDSVKVRVHIGARFEWPVWKEKRIATVVCTSFSEDGSYFSAVECERLKQGDGPYYTQKVKKRFSIDHAKITEYHAKLKELRKESADAPN